MKLCSCRRTRLLTNKSIWLVEVAEAHGNQIQLDGFDISSAHFPPKHELPENVTLRTLDIFQDIPTDLQGQYDIVHMARIGLFVQPSNLDLLLTNVKRLLSKYRASELCPGTKYYSLEPGGYLQWEEFDIDSRRILHPTGMEHPKADTFFKATKPLIQAQGLDFR